MEGLLANVVVVVRRLDRNNNVHEPHLLLVGRTIIFEDLYSILLRIGVWCIVGFLCRVSVETPFSSLDVSRWESTVFL